MYITYRCGEQHHDHLVCLDCGRVEEFFDPEIERRQNSVAKKHGFSLSEHALSLYGRCTKNACEHREKHSILTARVFREHVVPVAETAA